MAEIKTDNLAILLGMLKAFYTTACISSNKNFIAF
jgi:hypothetical protein